MEMSYEGDVCSCSQFQRGQPVLPGSQSGSVLHEGVGQACILAELEAEMGELEDFFQSESLIGAQTFLLETPASQHSISIWENCSNRSL